MPHSFNNQYLRYDGQIDENVKPILSGNNNLPIRVSNNKIFLDSNTELNGDLTFTNDSTTITGDDITLSAGTDISLHKSGATGLMSAVLSGEAITITAANGANSNLYLLSSGSADADVVIANSAGTNADSILIASIFGGVQIGCGSADDVLKLYGYQLNCDFVDSITLDSASGEFIAKKGGTEFSAANSSYAGMILAYTVIGESSGIGTYAMTTSLAVPDSDMNVSFVAPPSGKVEIMVQFHRDSVSSNKFVYVSLSDNATFNAVGDTYTQISTATDETDDLVCQHYWTVTGLTAGSSYQWWFGIRTNATSTNMKWGGTAGNRLCDFIMKATALPATLGGE